MRPKLSFAVLTFLTLTYKCYGETADQCPAQQPIYGEALKGFKFKTLVATSEFECLVYCHYEDKCQSYNYVTKTNICEMNNRTKEAKPDQFVSDPDRFYAKRGAHRKQVGSIPSLPAQTCREIKANEGTQAVSGNSWLDPTGSGEVILAYCDMNTEDFCIRHRCQNGASCVNSHVNYTCLCNEGWTGSYCDTSMMTERSCQEIKAEFPDAPDGMYQVQPENGLSVLVYCDMTSFGGGWTMCYSADSDVNLKIEVTYDENLPYGTNGYRTDCNNIPFHQIIFVDEATGLGKAFFTYKLNSTLIAAENYGTQLPGLWIGGSIADTSYEYELLICDDPFYTGFFVAGSTLCSKRCNNWCGDAVSPFFRTAAMLSTYSGVAFNVNGHRTLNERLIDVGLR